MDGLEGGRLVAGQDPGSRREPDGQVEYQVGEAGGLTPTARRLGPPHEEAQKDEGDPEGDRPADPEPARRVRPFGAGQQANPAAPDDERPSSGKPEDAEG